MQCDGYVHLLHFVCKMCGKKRYSVFVVRLETKQLFGMWNVLRLSKKLATYQPNFKVSATRCFSGLDRSTREPSRGLKICSTRKLKNRKVTGKFRASLPFCNIVLYLLAVPAAEHSTAANTPECLHACSRHAVYR